MNEREIDRVKDGGEQGQIRTADEQKKKKTHEKQMTQVNPGKEGERSPEGQGASIIKKFAVKSKKVNELVTCIFKKNSRVFPCQFPCFTQQGFVPIDAVGIIPEKSIRFASAGCGTV